MFVYLSGRNVRALFTIESQELVDTITHFGYLVFLLLTGVKIDVNMVLLTGKNGLYTGVASLVVPLLFGLGGVVRIGADRGLPKRSKLALVNFVALQSITPFPIVACLLDDLKILNSQLGRLGLSAALVSDMLSMFLQLITTLAIGGVEGGRPGQAVVKFAGVLLYLAFIIKVIRPAMNWIIRRTPEGRPVKNVYVYAILLYFIASTVMFQLVGISTFLAPFFLGLAIPDGPPLGASLVEKLDCFTSGVLLPLFITTRVMKANFLKINFSSEFLQVSGIITAIVVVAKFIGSMIPSMVLKLPKRDMLALAFIMSSKGVVDLVAVSFVRDNKILTDDIYSFMVVVFLATAIITPYGVKYFYDPSRKYAGYQRRNVLHLKPNAELRIVSTIHRPDNVAAILNLVDATCPTKERTVALYGLHIIELVGRASPLFISHRMQKRTLIKSSYSDNIIAAFSHYEHDHWEAVSANVYTALSPPRSMHEDICMLALNKLASLIVLPFHRKWSEDGSLESEDKKLRTLNSSVLEWAPCSVGILVDRGRLGGSDLLGPSAESPLRVAMIYIGGTDDREALTLAKRMAHGTNITLDVVHITHHSDKGISDWEKMYDSEILKDVKNGSIGSRNVSYREEMVDDGPNTALLIRPMANEYDLIIVGRRQMEASPQTLGLHEWSEFPELGVIGDLLATTDITGSFSVL
ncbi:Na_H_Exchanger domain-containing protein, partial [Psidium guajava]